MFVSKSDRIVKNSIQLYQEETKEFEYSQNSINIENSVETYGIKFDNGKFFQINFPIPDDETKGAIYDANGMLIYIISRNEYLSYEDLFGTL